MPRPRAFNETEALDAAMACFWQRGYQATTVRDLTNAMGLAAPSLYNAFGDKRRLYLTALDRYAAEVMRCRLAELSAAYPPRAAIAELFRSLIERSLAESRRRGCMIINAALEVAPYDPVVRRAVAGHLGELERFFSTSLARARCTGTAPCRVSPEDGGRLLLALLIAIRVAARARPEAELLEGMVRPAFVLLSIEPLTLRSTRR